MVTNSKAHEKVPHALIELELHTGNYYFSFVLSHMVLTEVKVFHMTDKTSFVLYQLILIGISPTRVVLSFTGHVRLIILQVDRHSRPFTI